MSKMSNEHLEMTEIALGPNDAEKIRIFGSVKACEEWLAEEQRLQDLADSVDPESEPALDSHHEWRANQILKDMEDDSKLI